MKLRRRLQLHFYTGSQNSLQRTDLSVFTGSKRVVFCTKVWLEKHFSPVKSYENAATSASQDETSPLCPKFLNFLFCCVSSPLCNALQNRFPGIVLHKVARVALVVANSNH